MRGLVHTLEPESCEVTAMHEPHTNTHACVHISIHALGVGRLEIWQKYSWIIPDHHGGGKPLHLWV